MSFDPISAILNVGGKIIDKLFPDKTEAEKIKLRMVELATQGEFKELDLLGRQIDVNVEEAKHPSRFIAGARPFVLWTCGSALAWQYVMGPMLYWFSALLNHPTPPLALNVGELMPVLLGILGLAGYRTYEKVKGVEGNR